MPLRLTPHLQPNEYTCGIACLECVLGYLQPGRAARATYRQWYWQLATGVDGTDPRAIETVLRQMGYRVVAGEMSISDLVYFTRRLPVIALLKEHYVVVAGVSKTRVGIMDPLEGNTSLGRRTFRQRWSDVDRFGTRYHQWGIVAGRR